MWNDSLPEFFILTFKTLSYSVNIKNMANKESHYFVKYI